MLEGIERHHEICFFVCRRHEPANVGHLCFVCSTTGLLQKSLLNIKTDYLFGTVLRKLHGFAASAASEIDDGLAGNGLQLR